MKLWDEFKDVVELVVFRAPGSQEKRPDQRNVVVELKTSNGRRVDRRQHATWSRAAKELGLPLLPVPRSVARCGTGSMSIPVRFIWDTILKRRIEWKPLKR